MRYSPDEVHAALGMARATLPWLTGLAALDVPDGDPLPSDGEVDALLRRLGVGSPAERAELIAARPTPDGTPHLWWLLTRCRQQLLSAMGRVDTDVHWSELPDTHGPAGRYLYPWALVSVVPATRGYHERHGVPDEVSWASLSDVGRQLALARRVLGRPGLVPPGWLTLHTRGLLYELGRLQYQRVRLPDGYTLDVHIPATGALSPGACDDSFARARAFFPGRFPGERYPRLRCVSWLLDEHLAHYLPPDSNILRFQRRFRVEPAAGAPGSAVGGIGADEVALVDTRSVFRLVFERQVDLSAESLAALPQDTTLARALVRHVRSGGYWRFRTGWCEW